MRSILYILLFLMCGVAKAYGQKPQSASVAKATEDSLRSSSTVSVDDLRDEMRGYIFRNTELEDSLDLYIIDSVENVRKLLSQCWKRLRKDCRQKHSRRQYQYSIVNNLARLTASQICTIENDDGIDLGSVSKDIISEWEPLSADSPVPFSPADSISIWRCMCANYDFNKFNHLEYNKWEYIYNSDWGLYRSIPIPLQLVNLYDIDAYSLSNDSGEGIYRIDLVQKKVKPKKAERNYSWPVHMIRLDFDLNSLRLIHQKGGFVFPGGRGLQYYRHDYGDEKGTPILTHFQNVIIRMPGYKVTQKVSVRLVEDE